MILPLPACKRLLGAIPTPDCESKYWNLPILAAWEDSFKKSAVCCEQGGTER